jgi:hypothetical protein
MKAKHGGAHDKAHGSALHTTAADSGIAGHHGGIDGPSDITNHSEVQAEHETSYL